MAIGRLPENSIAPEQKPCGCSEIKVKFLRLVIICIPGDCVRFSLVWLQTRDMEKIC